MLPQDISKRVKLEQTLDGFTASLPGHWLHDLILRLLRFFSAGLCFVLGEVVAIGLALCMSVPIPYLTSLSSTLELLWVLVPMLVFLGAVLGAIYGRKMSHWVFDKIEAWRERNRQRLSIKGDLLRIDERRIPLTDVKAVKTSGYSVSLVMLDESVERLAAPGDAEIRGWLQSTIQDILEQRDRGKTSDIPPEMVALKREQQGAATS